MFCYMLGRASRLFTPAIVASFALGLTIVALLVEAQISDPRFVHISPEVTSRHTQKSQYDNPQIIPRTGWGEGGSRYRPAWFTFQPKPMQEKPPALIATKPLPSNVPHPKPHAKGYKRFRTIGLHRVRARPEFKFKAKTMLGKTGKKRPLTHQAADQKKLERGGGHYIDKASL